MWSSLQYLHMTDCSHTREDHASHMSIGAASRNHNATCRQQTYGNAEPKSVVNWAPITRVLCCQTCTFTSQGLLNVSVTTRKQNACHTFMTVACASVHSFAHFVTPVLCTAACSFCGTHFKQQALLCPKQTATSSISSSSTGPQCITSIEDARTVKHIVKQ